VYLAWVFEELGKGGDGESNVGSGASGNDSIQALSCLGPRGVKVMTHSTPKFIPYGVENHV